MFRVVVTDLDGTLFGPDSQVDALTASTLREIEELGIQLVIATGRHYREASHLQSTLRIGAYLITSNGARVHGPGGARLFEQSIDPEVARALLHPDFVGPALVGAFTDDIWLLNRPVGDFDPCTRASGFRPAIQDLTSHDGANMAMIVYASTGEDMARLEAEIRGRFGGQVSLSSSSSRTLEVMGRGVSKGRALTEILLGLGAPRSSCIAFGDGPNDADMLSVAGRPFVMSGSSARLLAAFPDAPSAGSNNEAGVARTLRALLGLPTYTSP